MRGSVGRPEYATAYAALAAERVVGPWLVEALASRVGLNLRLIVFLSQGLGLSPLAGLTHALWVERLLLLGNLSFLGLEKGKLSLILLLVGIFVTGRKVRRNFRLVLSLGRS